MRSINENPHRLSWLSKVSIPQLLIEGSSKKFGYTMSRGDTHMGHVIGLTLILFMMGLILTGVVAIFTPNLVTPAFTFAFPLLLYFSLWSCFYQFHMMW